MPCGRRGDERGKIWKNQNWMSEGGGMVIPEEDEERMERET